MLDVSATVQLRQTYARIHFVSTARSTQRLAGSSISDAGAVLPPCHLRGLLGP